MSISLPNFDILYEIIPKLQNLPSSGNNNLCFLSPYPERGYALSSPTEKLGIEPQPLTSIFKSIQDSVVQITRPSPFPPAIPNNTDQNTTALGSGFIYDIEGRIITNSHVVGDSKSVDVMFINGSRYVCESNWQRCIQ